MCRRSHPCYAGTLAIVFERGYVQCSPGESISVEGRHFLIDGRLMLRVDYCRLRQDARGVAGAAFNEKPALEFFPFLSEIRTGGFVNRLGQVPREPRERKTKRGSLLLERMCSFRETEGSEGAQNRREP